MNLLISWLPYLALILLMLVFNSHPNNKTNISGFFFSFLILFTFSAVRFNVGYDYGTYYKLIEDVLKEEIAYSRLEYFNRVLIDVSRYINFPQLFFIISSFLVCFLVFITIKRNSIQTDISIWYFIGFPLFFMQSLTIIRQWIAIAFVFYGINFLKNNRYVFYLLTIFIASLWHQTAFVGLMIIPLFYFKSTKGLNIILLLSAPILYNILPEIIVRSDYAFLLKAQEYINNGIGEGNVNTKIIFIAIFFDVVNLLFYDKITKKDIFSEKLITIYNFGVVFFVIFQRFGFIGGRGASYFLVFLILIAPYYKNILSVKDELFLNILNKGVMILLFFTSLYISYNTYQNKKSIIDPYTPYEIFLGKEVSDLKLY